MLKINAKDEATIKSLIKDGALVAKVKGAVHFLNEGKERATEKEVIAYLGKYGFIAPKRSNNFRSSLYELLVKGDLNEAGFNDLLVDASDNTLNNRKHFNAIRELCNTVRTNATKVGLGTNKGVK